MCCKLLVLLFTIAAGVLNSNRKCEVRTLIDTGWICGLRRQAENDVQYASFRGIPYAKQPVRELRFKELQPMKPWQHHLLAVEEGPICPQDNEVYNPDRGMSEACITVNVHVPWNALNPLYTRRIDYEYNDEILDRLRKGASIFVFIHGGGFVLGSGDSDLHGPEYLVSKGVIVVTFNYRLNVFGFLSLNSSKVPGNNGLRDQIFLLKWVQRNARAFGGNPSDITLGGQRSGAACVHLLTLSPAARGLFRRAIIMSGTAIPSFYTTSPTYAKMVARRFLALLGINSTNVDEIHTQLVHTSLEDILKANKKLQQESEIASFSPVVESRQPGVVRILDDDPINLINLGRGKRYPIIVGFSKEECQFFKNRKTFTKIVEQIESNPTAILPLRIPYSTPSNMAYELAYKVIDTCFNGSVTFGKYLEVCRDSLFAYPAFKVAELRAKMKRSAPLFLYQFSYENEHNMVKNTLFLQYYETGHVEDQTFIFRENAILGKLRPFSFLNRDDKMRDWMTQFVINFIRCNQPSCEGSWPPVNLNDIPIQDIREPYVYRTLNPTKQQTKMIKFFDEIDELAKNASKRNATRRQNKVNPELWLQL